MQSALNMVHARTEAGAKPGTGYPCRFCGAGLTETFVDLGVSPLCESLVDAERLADMEPFYPLRTFVCGRCFLVQLPEHVAPAAIFEEYAYFSSYSDSWLAHARAYVDGITDRLGLGRKSLVVEIASNDGYLLQYFVARGIPVLGIEPARNVAQVAVAKGIPCLTEFFGRATAERVARRRGGADLILGNNVLAHVPDINDFVAGMKVLLKPGGVVTMEFPHLLRLIEGNQFDTIYHEHFSYLSFTTVEQIFAAHGLRLFDVEELRTHGGSLRIYACHADNADRGIGAAVAEMKAREAEWGIASLRAYRAFARRVERVKRDILRFLIDAKSQGKSIVGYGAPGKGNTLLNYCGIRTDFLDFTVDRNPYKHGKYTPGARIPIRPVDAIKEARPDYLFILPWNLKDEVMQQMAFIRDWGGKFVVPIPEVTVYE